MLNEFHSEFMRELSTGLAKRTRFRFLNEVVGTLQKISGVLDGTMSRNASHTFLVLGRNLERADMTSRIVDVRSAQLLPAETPEPPVRDRAMDERPEVIVGLSDVSWRRAFGRSSHGRAGIPAAQPAVPGAPACSAWTRWSVS